MKRRRFLSTLGCLATAGPLLRAANAFAQPQAGQDTDTISGPLRIHPVNRRYFADASGRAMLLTGSHVWNNLVDMVRSDGPEPFDFSAYLDFLQRYGHNFIRLWTWDSTAWDTRANGRLGKDFVHQVAPLPWARTGPEPALDGQPQFDLTRFEPEYFNRLRNRLRDATERGIYVSVMLFEGWGLMHGNLRRPSTPGWAWQGHPFHRDNNRNGIDAGVAGEANVGRPHRLGQPEVNAIQKAYIQKVVDTVNDLDNVMYEVINEGGDQEWDWWVVQTLQDYQRTKAKQHPIGITGHGAERLDTMLASPADWISPGRRDGFADNPPAWNESKVSLLDTDHVWGVGGNGQWVWKSFLRGHNPIFMDPYDGSVLGNRFDPRWESIRRNMGFVRQLSQRCDLAKMEPHDGLASTGYCLAAPDETYLVYASQGTPVTIDLRQAKGRFSAEWIECDTFALHNAETVDGGAEREFLAPTPQDGVLRLARVAQ